jgi:hypothetical protein
MIPLLLGAAGLALVLVPLVILLRRRPGRPAVLPTLRGLPVPMPWERAYWRRAPKDGGPRG